MADPYAWDVFVSYPNTGDIPDWTEDFAYLLERELKHLGVSSRVFVAPRSLPPGVAWPVKLAEAHHRSKTFVPVLCGPYFRHPWCLSEWSNAVRRAETERTPLVVPVQYNNCTDDDLKRLRPTVREQVARVQRFDLSDYNTLFERTARDARVTGLRLKIQDLSTRLRPLIERPPAWNPAWPRLPRTATARLRTGWLPRLEGE